MDHLLSIFMEILSLKKGDAESIYSVLIDWRKTNNVECNKLVQQIVDVWIESQEELLFNAFCFIVAS